MAGALELEIGVGLERADRAFSTWSMIQPSGSPMAANAVPVQSAASSVWRTVLSPSNGSPYQYLIARQGSLWPARRGSVHAMSIFGQVWAGAGAVVLASACSRAPASGTDRGSGLATAPAPTGPTAAGSVTPAAPVATVTLAGTGGGQQVTVEVVRSPALLEKGLMYRRFMPADHGMLFLMGEVEDHHFWMKNTLIPLDIVFITNDLTVAGTAANAKPLDLTPVSVGKPSLYVLEVNGGWTASHGVGAGAKVTFANVEQAAR